MKKRNILKLLTFVGISSFVNINSNVYCQNAGDIDLTFGTSGVVISTYPDPIFGESFDEVIQSIEIQPDNKIVVAGYGQVKNGITVTNDFIVSRYNTDGSIDISFGTDGRTTTDINSNSTDLAFGMKIQNDGKIVLVGETNSSGNKNIAITRYNTDGTIDVSFGSSGIVLFNLGYSNSSFDVIIQNDGKILITGDSFISGNRDLTLVRLTSSGQFDTGFGTNGIVNTALHLCDNYGKSVAVQDDGKIVLGGYANNSSNIDNMDIVRYNSDGSLDNTFGTSGVTSNTINNSDFIVSSSLLIQPDGKLIHCASFGNGINFDIAITRTNTDGTADLSYGTNGLVITDFGAENYIVQRGKLQSDGKLVVTGNTTVGSDLKPFIARYNSNGSLDNAFGTNGKVIASYGSTEDRAFALAINGNKVLIGGDYDNGTKTDFSLTQYHLGTITSVKDEISKMNISVYPNPVSNQLSINAELEINEINIIDITGKVIKASKQNKNTINVADLPDGIYTVKIFTDKETIIKKFIKQ